MVYEIKSRWDSKVLFTADVASLALAVQAAIKSGANLYGANLFSANLSSADLRSANLSSADLRSANLSGADLRRANLSSANLSSADLSGANLYGANLFSANLSSADLSGANLYGANLSSADLSGANLYGANLRRANLSGADLRKVKNAELPIAQTVLLPEGNLVGWKKCQNDVIVKLLIPQKARRSSASGRKCRAEYATVLRVYGAETAISVHDGKTIYRKGETVNCDNWNTDRWTECGGGIHFYITRVEAENH